MGMNHLPQTEIPNTCIVVGDLGWENCIKYVINSLAFLDYHLLILSEKSACMPAPINANMEWGIQKNTKNC